ncbi:MAG: Tol-Pal system beta propeller repeat protein TolB [Deltaproteobacteria bacterium RIFCSPLOWO2_12_FULL_40_28]|nr:MAG: Tol-Pal system beta propeller repeat protein TolB [Deltaproteobacteria bacterium RIFCSPHIGHO2_02_FULL_40_28]OGQ19066.1 MAG: Tol-Pal system beta propeller repeat protein TolB [Deltaproteobacteria bacterium RIFCSPHIGHO2_12_FULL_40_32]OGQ40238.1 MAG: Tol-Pal system beta propeller repeat protein TolB [Deltaproteobacteria bacterium RIFCSPLOWO2_02_FULL_40_36]OGQ53509.1 MAG: Tol-Pal system beta propeller repeat protein TolB [Deltaproteobacteria bacterium RIFCSPLOWO2_12_FULL_40_28]
MKKILLMIFLILIPFFAHAKIYILIEEASTRKFPIAVPEFLTTSGKESPYTKELTKLVIKNLELAGLFKVLDEHAFLDQSSSVSEIDFSKWTAIEALALVKGIVDQSGSKSTIEIRLYDTQTQQMLVGKQYSLKQKEDYPDVVHHFVDDLMEALTGTKGPFTSKIATACGKSNLRQINSFAVDGTQRTAVTRLKANNISPNWSPEGSLIVFTSFLKYYPEIYSIGADGSGLKQLTNSKSTSITPAFSPDGNTIAYATSRSGDTELYLMTKNGRLINRITSIANIDVSPAWSPDGGRLVFASERAGNLHLFSSAADGSSTTRLTYTGYQNDQPDWSPDGKKIVFTSRDRGAFDVFMMNADGSMIQRITRDEGNNESPSWAPDSRYIVFSSARAGTGIYMMLADGNSQSLIPNTGGCINPDWSPRL